jgi:hypothetical protein
MGSCSCDFVNLLAGICVAQYSQPGEHLAWTALPCRLKMACQVVNPSKHDQKAVIQFLRAEGCYPAEIHMQVFFFVHCAACVLNTVTLHWFHIFLTVRQSMTSMPRQG